MDIQTKDGILLRNIPDGTPEEAIKARIADIRKSRSQPSPQAPAQAEKKRAWSDVPMEAISNIPKSGAEFVGNIYQAVRHPLDTATALKDVFVGGVQNALPEWAQAESARGQREQASAVGQFFKDRYGSVEGLKKTIATDPVGLLADASTVFGGVGGVASRAPGVVGKIGQAVSTTGRAIDPIMMAGKATKATLAPIGKAAAHTIGGIGTHTGGQGLITAAKAGYSGGQHADDFLANLRGNVPAEDVVSEAKRAVSSMAKARGAEYRAGMAGVKADPTVLDFSNIDRALADATKTGTFKGKSIARSTTKTLDDIRSIVDDWRNADPAQFHTPEGMDALKRAIGDIRDSTEFRTPSRAVADSVYSAVKNEIVKQAPGYGKVMKGYESATKQIRELEKGLSLGEKASADTALRKLQSVMRNNANTNYGNRVKMAEQLADAGAPTLMDQLAGQSLSSWTPRGLGNIQAGGTAVASILSPYLLSALPLQSPRLMGEFAYYGGKAARPIGKGAKALAPYATPAFQTGRIEELLRNAGLLGE